MMFSPGPLLGRLLLPAVLLLAGCVERKLVIRSDPTDADVWIDGEFVGKTPTDFAFSWYGTREILLEKKGYETLRTEEQIAPPWWQYPVFDLLTDVVIPITFTDFRDLKYRLSPSPATLDTGPVEDRAGELKKDLEKQMDPEKEP